MYNRFNTFNTYQELRAHYKARFDKWNWLKVEFTVKFERIIAGEIILWVYIKGRDYPIDCDPAIILKP